MKTHSSTDNIINNIINNINKKYKIIERDGCGKKGVFIVLEGIDGSGTTTHTKLLSKTLKELIINSDIITTKEPTSGEIGKLIRTILKKELKETYSIPQIMSLLFAADRLYHIYSKNINQCKGVIDCINKGYIIVSDRYKYSSYAYQQISINNYIGSKLSWIIEVNSYAIPPHILVFIESDPKESLDIIEKERGQTQLYENKLYLEKVLRNYVDIVDMLKRNPEYHPNSNNKNNRSYNWIELAENVGVNVECLYPEGVGYPRVITVKKMRSIEETGYEIVSKVIGELLGIGVIETVE